MKKWNQTFVQWFLSYFLIYGLMLAVSAAIFTYAIHTVRGEADRMQEELVRQIGDEVESVTSHTRDILQTLLSRKGIEYLMAVEKEHYTYKEHMHQSDIQDYIVENISTSSELEDIYVYSPISGYLLHSTEVVNESFYQGGGEAVSKNQGILVQMDSGESGIQLFQAGGEWLIGWQENYSRSYCTGTVMAVLKQSAFKSLLAGDVSTYYLVTQEGKAITTEGVIDAPEYLLELMESEMDPGKQQVQIIQKNNVIYSCEKLTDSGFMLIGATSMKDYARKIRLLEFILVVYVVVSLTVSFYLSYMAVRKRYQKLQNLLLLSGAAKETDKDDFTKLEHKMRRILEQNERRQQNQLEQEIAIRNLSMAKILHGRVAYLNERELQYCREKAPLVGKDIFLIGITLEDERFFGEEADSVSARELRELMYFSVENVAEELFRERFACMAAEVNGTVYLLVGTERTYDRDRFVADVKARAWEMADFLRQSCRIDSTVIISRVYESLEYADVCLQEINECKEFRDIRQDQNKIILYEEIIASGDAQWEKKKEQARKKNEKIRRPSEKPKKELSEAPVRDGEGSWPDEADQKTATSEHLVDHVVARIREDFRNPELTINQLAEEFSLSPSNLSQLFKRKMKIGPYEYISTLRFELAQELILQGEPVKDVAEKVGYYNTKPLNRIFRENFEMSPVQWRESMLEKMKNN